MVLLVSDGHILPINGNNYTWHQAPEVFISQDRIDIGQVPERFKKQNWLIDRPKEAPQALPQALPKESIKVKDIHRLPNGHYRIDLEENISSTLRPK